MLPLIATAFFHDFLESLGNGILLCNIANEVYAANSAAAEILGLDGPQSCLGKEPGELFRDLSDKPAFLSFFAEMSAADLPGRSYRDTLSRAGSADIHLALSVSRLFDSGKLFGLLITITDLSDVVRLHEREKKYLQENAELAREKHDSLRHFADAVAHQLRNPLMAIGGFANIMQRNRSTSDPDMPRLEAILDSAKRLEKIVTVVRDYNALSLANPAPTLVSGVLPLALLGLSRRRPDLAAAASIREDMTEALLPLDQELFAAAFEAVLENALEAQGADGILVSGRITDGRYSLSVTDNGPGIRDAIAPFVFDFFFTTKAQGIGMGLPKALKIAREHTGKLTLESTPGQGTTATFSLPLSPAD